MQATNIARMLNNNSRTRKSLAPHCPPYSPEAKQHSLPIFLVCFQKEKKKMSNTIRRPNIAQHFGFASAGQTSFLATTRRTPPTPPPPCSCSRLSCFVSLERTNERSSINTRREKKPQEPKNPGRDKKRTRTWYMVERALYPPSPPPAPRPYHQQSGQRRFCVQISTGTKAR